MTRTSRTPLAIIAAVALAVAMLFATAAPASATTMNYDRYATITKISGNNSSGHIIIGGHKVCVNSKTKVYIRKGSSQTAGILHQLQTGKPATVIGSTKVKVAGQTGCTAWAAMIRQVQ